MRYWLLVLLFPYSVFCQSKKTKRPVIKQRDSVYYESRYDTTFGIIEYNILNGKVKGEGIIVKYDRWQWHKWVPEEPPKRYGSGKDTFWVYSGGAMGKLNMSYTSGFIKTNKGYKIIDEKFLFTPKLD